MFSKTNHHYQDERIRYLIVDCGFGRLLVAATQHGICLTEINDQDSVLLEYLQARLPQATIEHLANDSELKNWADQARSHIDGECADWTAPLDVRGTAFQVSVWQHLVGIPVGQTKTYGQVARAINRPSASRAVGAAIGHNPIAIHIACHRVIGQKGALTGFRWGLAMKKQILAREGVISKDW